MKLYTFQTNFSRGEFSPLMYGRVDFAGYPNACKTMENFHALPQGGAIRSPGLRYIATALSNDDRVRVIPFVVSSSLSFVLVFTDLKIRFIKDFEVVTSGTPYEIASPYALADLARVQYRQYGQVMILTHPNYPPKRLRRLTDTKWVLDNLPFAIPALAEQGHKHQTGLTLSALTGTVTATVGLASFGGAKDIGRYIAAGTGLGVITAVASALSATVQILSDFDLLSYVSGEWTLLDSPLADITPSVKGLGDVGTMTAGSAIWFGSGGGAGEDDVGKYIFINGGIAQITALTSTTIANIKIVKALETIDKAFGGAWALKSAAWSSANGYPRTLEIQEGRLWFGGSTAFPTTVWASEINNILNIGGIGVADADPFEWILSSDRLDEIIHMKAGKRLAVFTYGSEYIFSASDGGPVVPLDIQVSRQSANGASNVGPVTVGSDIMFVQRLGKELRAMTYALEQDAYDSPDISFASEHLFRSGIRAMTYAATPYKILWLVNNDGDMIQLCVDRSQSLFAFSPRRTAGRFLDVCSLPVQGQDRVFVVVARTVNGVERRFIEVFDYDYQTDSGKQQTFGSPTSSIGGYSYIPNMAVQVVGDGVVFDDAVTSGTGTFTLSAPVSTLEAGLPFESRLIPLPTEIPLNGTSQGRKAAVDEVMLRLVDSKAAKINGRPVAFRTMGVPLLNQPLESFTGDKRMFTLSGWEYGQPEIEIVQDKPLPITITGLRRTITIND